MTPTTFIVGMLLILAPVSFGKTKSQLSPAYAKAAIKTLNEMNDTEFHAFHYARDVAAKTAADKLSIERLKAFLLIHHLTVLSANSVFATEKDARDLHNQTECATQWKMNLRYMDSKVPTACGLNF